MERDACDDRVAFDEDYYELYDSGYKEASAVLHHASQLCNAQLAERRVEREHYSGDKSIEQTFRGIALCHINRVSYKYKADDADDQHDSLSDSKRLFDDIMCEYHCKYRI